MPLAIGAVIGVAASSGATSELLWQASGERYAHELIVEQL